MTLVALLVFSSVGASPTAAQVNTCTQWAYNPPGPIVMPVNSPTSQALYLLVSGGPSQFTTINSVSLVSNTSPPPLPSAKVVAIQQPGTGSGGAIVSFDSSGVPPGCYGLYVNFNITASQAWTNFGSAGTTGCAPGATEDASGNCWGCFPDWVRVGQECFYGPIDSLSEFATVTVTSSTQVLLQDPIPNLVIGSAVKSADQLQSLLTSGRTVAGIAADGVTQIVVRIQGQNNAGHSFTVQLRNDQQTQSSSPGEDGALGNPGEASLSSSQVTVTAGSADRNGIAYAFAVYRGPVDFTRPTAGGFKSGTCNGTSNTDDKLACRSVSLQVQDVTTGNPVTVATVPITILRPPVILVHGLWSDFSEAWKNFSPLVTGPKKVDPRFFVGRVNYAYPVPGITATNPPLVSGSIGEIRGNSLGLQYNAPHTADQIATLLQDFKNGNNPNGNNNSLGIPVASVQVDIIAHSLGGVLTRQLALLPRFLDSSNLMHGYIHKIITLDSPHLGTPLAAQLVAANNSCTRGFLEDFGNYSLTSVTLSGGSSANGAVGDVMGNGIAVDTSLSPVLRALASQGPMSLPAALVAGNYTNWTALDCNVCVSGRIRAKCPNDPLAQSLTSDGFPGIFGVAPNNLNDGIVGVISQVNGATSSSLQFNGLAHSPGIVGRLGFGFSPPTVLHPANGTPPNPIADEVITLLNIPVTQPPYSAINP